MRKGIDGVATPCIRGRGAGNATYGSFSTACLKALLIHLGHLPPKAHGLAELQRALVKVDPLWHRPVEDLRLLTLSAVAFRYPGESAERDEAKEALRIASGIRKLARQALGLMEPSRRVKR
jgi:HEPN domain-containing protein